MRTTNDEKLPLGHVVVGDALRLLERMPPKSVDTVVTSPPYWLLRNYQVDGQLGAEPSIEEWVEHLSAVLTQTARVLKPEGTVWLNLGDTYSRRPSHGAPRKSLVLGPERLLLRLLQDGWLVRNKVVWTKTTHKPDGVRDRLTTAWEPLYLLTRSDHYFFDLDLIREPLKSQRSRAAGASKVEVTPLPDRTRPSWAGPFAGNNSGLRRMKARGSQGHPLGKNPGDVWALAPSGYRGAHFATFSERLVERTLLASCPERICHTCGLAWRRSGTVRFVGAVATRSQLRKSCGCADRTWRPGVVLDPFMGAGTVGVVAERLHRRWTGIELNPAFAAMATDRIAAAASAGRAA